MAAYQLYWGDIHSHCAISYGHGTVEQALARARQQLDFCSVTGHAFWPDMPTDRDRYAEIIDYHREGFARLANNWPKLLAAQDQATVAGRFIALPSYEWHSLEYGDHNVYAAGPELELLDAENLPALREMARRQGAIIAPHHIGYAAGYRGVDWRSFRGDLSPLVEIFSLHGCSESDQAPYPMLHDMGPRDYGSTAEAGWRMGHRFGVIGSTDHHGAYPGSHGDGRMGAFATELTRQGLWEAFLARRVFAATGDKIDARLFVDDAWIGAEIQSPGRRRLRVEAHGANALDCVEVIKNHRTLRRFYPAGQASGDTFRLRLTWGWGQNDKLARWDGRVTLSEGEITRVEPCFSGQSIVAPQADGAGPAPDEQDLPHAVVESGPKHCAWRSVTTGNRTMRHATTQALSLEIKAPENAELTIEVNGRRFSHPLPELRLGGRCHYMRGWLSEAIRVGPLVPLHECVVNAAFDDEPEQNVDIYRLRVSQKNGHWAWLTPIWAER